MRWQAGYELPTLASLLLVLGVLGTGVGLSVITGTGGTGADERSAEDS